MTNDQVILAPLVTEKSTLVTEHANQVVFRVHAQQINIMDKTSGKTIASIRR